jgi:hypothetical protein
VRQFNSLRYFGGLGHRLLSRLLNRCVIRLSFDHQQYFSLRLFILLLRYGYFIFSKVGLVYLWVVDFTFLTESIVVTLAQSAVDTFLVLLLLMFKRFFTFT